MILLVKKITAEGCRLAGLPNNQGNEQAYSLAWTVLAVTTKTPVPMLTTQCLQNKSALTVR